MCRTICLLNWITVCTLSPSKCRQLDDPVINLKWRYCTHLQKNKSEDIRVQEIKTWCSFLATYETFTVFLVLLTTVWQHIYGSYSRLPNQWRKTQEEELKASYVKCCRTTQDPWLQILIRLHLKVSLCSRWKQCYFHLFILDTYHKPQAQSWFSFFKEKSWFHIRATVCIIHY